MALLYAVTLFASAGLLFVLQPLAARLVLPLLGGTPAVWATCMVFFQALLLAGYAYAHAAPARLGVRRHALLHLLVLLVPLAFLPVALPANAVPSEDAPVLWLLGVLAVSVGLPFLVVSTTAPLLQRWFAETAHPSAHDPYFLYAASNLGSIAALLAYPFLVEPSLGLADQGRWWAGGYLVLIGLTGACALALFLSPRRDVALETEAAPPVGAGRRARWVLLAFVPSSLLLSTTTYLTTDLASVPLLWVVPLALYLATFIHAFARRRVVSQRLLRQSLPVVVLLLVLALVSEATQPVVLLMALHLFGLTWVGLYCHGALADDRPHAGRLTEFYLWMSAGGVLGGLFNALLAPLVFSSLVEYPLVLVLACLLRPTPRTSTTRARWLDLALPAALGAVTALAVVVLQTRGLPPGPISIAAMFGVPLVVCYTFIDRPVRFGLGLAALLLASSFYRGVYGEVLERRRSFFGVHKVTLDPTRRYRELVHGNTVHGLQDLDPARRREPLGYYTRSGPMGRVFRALADDPRFRRVGLVGLGAGALACFGQPGQRWTFFEIDPVVISLARDAGWFSYLADCEADLDVVRGDARLTLSRTDERFDVLVIDAFSSDAIPVHLLTREALAVYLDRLAPHGVLAFNISNRYLDLRPVLADLAQSAGEPLVALWMNDRALAAGAGDQGKSPSVWAVLTRDPKVAERIRTKGWWEPLTKHGRGVVWTDDYSNILGVFRWRDEE